jgi:pimeloyl-ACP methyl ester carboxylesterase
MERRTALKSMLLALAGGDAASAARKPSGVAPRATIAEAADKTRLHFRDWGAGRPIVFVAPWALSSDWWDMPMSVFAERGWRCVAFDRRGHGRSEEPGRGYDFDTLADDIAAVMNALDLQNVVLVGHSLGGAEVVRYLTRHRSRRVAHAVLIAPTTPFGMKTEDHPDGMSKENLEKTLESIRRDFPRQVAKAASDFFGVPKNPVPAETMDWWCRQIVDRSSVKGSFRSVQDHERDRFSAGTANHPNTYADSAGRHRQIGPTGIDRPPDSRTDRWQPVVGIRECGSRSAVHAHGSYAHGYRRVCANVRATAPEDGHVLTQRNLEEAAKAVFTSADKTAELDEGP